jgi:hypothetical protein
VVLRALPYADRALVYRMVAAAFEWFLHPASLVILVAILIVLAAARRRRTGAPTDTRPEVTQDVFLRAEPPGHVSFVFSTGRSGLERDFVVDRRPEGEERILEGFDALARRMASFAPADRGGRASRGEIDEARREIRALGLEMGQLFLGPAPAAADRLLDLKGDHLLLRIAPELARFPWELLVAREGGQFLWQLFHVSRQIRDEVAAPGAAGRSGAPVRLLLLADLEAGESGRSLPAAEREAGEILELSVRAPERIRVVRKSPRSAEEVRTLIAQGFDVVHFAGHAEATGEDGPCWVLGGGAAAPLDGLFGGAAPLLVFANACGSGGSATLTEERVGDAARVALRQGVGAYVGTLWELHDAGSAAFAASFYRALVGGSTLGAAMTAARSAVLGAHPFTWANYVLYGDPARRALDSFVSPKRSHPLRD